MLINLESFFSDYMSFSCTDVDTILNLFNMLDILTTSIYEYNKLNIKPELLVSDILLTDKLICSCFNDKDFYKEVTKKFNLVCSKLDIIVNKDVYCDAVDIPLLNLFMEVS